MNWSGIFRRTARSLCGVLMRSLWSLKGKGLVRFGGDHGTSFGTQRLFPKWFYLLGDVCGTLFQPPRICSAEEFQSLMDVVDVGRIMKIP
ncbi:UNVERIFIED_CONTAM: hypothetical protein Slati_2688500 [Sesamum latifolium]|uniref:Uncharacterized protein n=1 Tax=Sesamum latifolium TaxID=2727402 RepID=A0AAW2VVE4_9LAMI